jgi:cell division protein FtsW
MVDQFGQVPESARRDRPSASGRSGVRERWRTGVEARALVLVTLILIGMGLAVLFSASALSAIADNKPAYYFLLRQAQGVLAGAVVFVVAARVDAERWRGWAWPLMGLSLLAMLITVLPFTKSIAGEFGGSRRFLFGGSIQPAEFAKLAVILWTPMLLVKKGPAMRRLGKGLGPFLLVIGVLSLLAMMQPDLSMAMTFCLLMAIILFAGGARTAHFVFLGMLAVPLLVQQVQSRPYLRSRVDTFMAKYLGLGESDATVDYQQDQSLIAVGSGGLLGVGYGEGNQQQGWVPLSYNDFIASVVGEEFGFVGIAALVLAFAAYAWLGFRIARTARTPFQALVAIGLTYATVITAFVHIGVTIGLLPNAGLTLPFVSYGRSNLVLTLLMTGILVNIGSAREKVFGTGATDPFAAGDR